MARASEDVKSVLELHKSATVIYRLEMLERERLKQIDRTRHSPRSMVEEVSACFAAVVSPRI